MACLLWEDSFYENGVSVADRIATLVPKVPARNVAALAVKARSEMNLRHVPLLIVAEMCKHEATRWFVEETLYNVIQRPDEIAEFLAIYWRNGKCPIAASAKRGLASAFEKFSEYQLAKHDHNNAAISLRDVMFLVHPRPKSRTSSYVMAPAIAKANYKRGPTRRHDDEFGSLYARVASETLATPDTWEVYLSKKDGIPAVQKWTELLERNALGAMALFRNLRNMEEAGVDRQIVRKTILNANVARMFPFRFFAAAKNAPNYAREIEEKFFEAAGSVHMPGLTLVLVDKSGSMSSMTSGRSQMSYSDAAASLATIAREMYDDCVVFGFNDDAREVDRYLRGFGLHRDLARPSGGTYLGKSLSTALSKYPKARRVIVITDEQSADALPMLPLETSGYIVNVAAYQNGIDTGGRYLRVNGWSEKLLHYIAATEGVNPWRATEE
jgi:hypothetical protein